MNLLFICSKNQWRSPTAEQVWRRQTGLSVRSAGTSPNARHPVSSAENRRAWRESCVGVALLNFGKLSTKIPQPVLLATYCHLFILG